MADKNWQQVREIFDAALDHNREDRQKFVREACRENQTLLEEVESLLASADKLEVFMEEPAFEQFDLITGRKTEKLETDRCFNQYQIIKRIGTGGMGDVYLAHDKKLDRKVALKVLPPEFARDAYQMSRFVREAKSASVLNHPNIITIYEIGEADGVHFIAIEFIDGKTISAYNSSNQKSLNTDLEIAVQVTFALAAAHEAGIIHRDIKPDNIMIRLDGIVKVLDFGIAKATKANDFKSESKNAVKDDTMPGIIMGTPQFMSPEQSRGKDIDHQSDIFSFGVVLYEMFSGISPFRGETVSDIIAAVLTFEPPRLVGVPTELADIVHKSLQKDKKKRYQTARSFWQQLKEFQQEFEIENRVEKKSATAVNVNQQQIFETPPKSGIKKAVVRSLINTVGREKEKSELQTAFKIAVAQRGKLMCFSGEPGIGKTTLVENFLNEISGDNQTVIVRGRSSERLAGTEVYLPFLEVLENLVENDHGLMQVLKQLAPTWFEQIATLSENSHKPAKELKLASQERMKREFANFLQVVSDQNSLVVFFDDLHWADVSTIDMLNFLASRFDTLRCLIIATYRPTDMLIAKHPFLQIKPDLQARGLCQEFFLEFLTEKEIAEYLTLTFPKNRFPVGFAKLIHAKTEGSPLFMADLVRYLRNHQVIANTSGVWKLEQTLPDIQREMPESVRGMIERKIAQLSEFDNNLLTVASVQGYEFDSAVVAQVLELEPDEVEGHFERFERVYAFVKLTAEAEFPNRTLTLKYRFVHVLYQNALFSVLRATRKANLSCEVAQVLESFYGDKTNEAAHELAVLWESAREPARAAAYFLHGAQQAGKMFASHEAGQIAQRALNLVQQLSETEEKMRLELPLQVLVGNYLLAKNGLADPTVGETYNRIRELSERTSDTQYLLPMLFGQASYHIFRGEFEKALKTSFEFRDIAERENDPSVIVADRLIGMVNLFKGELNTARKYLEQSLTAYNAKIHRELASRYGSEPAVIANCLLILTNWLQGYPEKALANMHEAQRIAAKTPHPHTQNLTLVYSAILHQYLRLPEKVAELTEKQIRLSEEGGLAMWRALGGTINACANGEIENNPSAVNEMQNGIKNLRDTGTQIFSNVYFFLAELCGKFGQTEIGLVALREAQKFIEKNNEFWLQAELYRLHGELQLQNDADENEAETHFQRAIEIARLQTAKSLELRATMSLSRLWQKQGKTAKARKSLAKIYNWFTEGFDTADLQNVKDFLDKL
jgi:serine/threonine protein kinase/predicted ATPase